MIVHTFIVMLEAAASATATFLRFFVTSVADVSALKQSILCVCVCLGGGGTCTDVVYGTHLVTDIGPGATQSYNVARHVLCTRTLRYYIHDMRLDFCTRLSNVA